MTASSAGLQLSPLLIAGSSGKTITEVIGPATVLQLSPLLIAGSRRSLEGNAMAFGMASTQPATDSGIKGDGDRDPLSTQNGASTQPATDSGIKSRVAY